MTIAYIKDERLNYVVYRNFCDKSGIDITKAVFIYGGDFTHSPSYQHFNELNTPYISMFEFQPPGSVTRGGIMEVAHAIVENNGFVLSLPVGFSYGRDSEAEVNLIVNNAIANLYEAFGAGYTLILPIRHRLQYKNESKGFVFNKHLADFTASEQCEPRFWSNISGPLEGQEWLPDNYIDKLNELTQFIKLSPVDRQKLVDADKDYPFYRAYIKGKERILAQANSVDQPIELKENLNKKEKPVVADTITDGSISQKKAKLQLTYLEIDPDKPIKTVADYQESLTSLGLKRKNKPVLIFPGDTQPKNTSSATLYSVKGDKAGLAAVAMMIGNAGYPTLNLPIRGIAENWETVPAQREFVIKAIADLYKAVGCNHTLVLPVRNVAFEDKTTLFGDEFLPNNPGEAPRGLEPAFWGGNQKDVNPALAKYYLEELTKLHNFISKTPEERFNCSERGQVDDFFWDAYSDGRTIRANNPWLRAELLSPVDSGKTPKKLSISSTLKTPASSTQQVDPVFIYIEGKITLDSYKAACRQNNIDPENKKVVFIFPGNTGHHSSKALFQKRLFEKKGGSGLAEFTGELGDRGYPVLSLPTTGMEKWSENNFGEKAIVQKAIEDLYEAVGCGYSLALPVRSRVENPVFVPGTDNRFFPSGLANVPNLEPNFWGQNNITPNEGLSAEYINALNKLANFMKLSPDAKEETIALDKDNPLFRAYKRGQASLVEIPAPVKVEGFLVAEEPVVAEKSVKTEKPVSLQHESASPITPSKVQSSKITFPASYERIYKTGADPLRSALALLNDYTKDNSSLKRFAFLHWNRHHVSAVNTIVENSSITQITDLIQALDKINLVNPNGSLASRIAFIKEKNQAPNLSNDGDEPHNKGGYHRNNKV